RGRSRWRSRRTERRALRFTFIMVKVGCSVTKLRLEPQGEEPMSRDAETSLLGGRSAAAAKTASQAATTAIRLTHKNIGLRRCLAALVALAVVSVEASSSKFFQAATQAAFLTGEVENLPAD